MALLPALQPVSELPPILSGAATPQIRERVERFYLSIPEIFEAWVKRCESPHTQRAYRADVTEFIKFFGVVWPKDAKPAPVVPLPFLSLLGRSGKGAALAGQYPEPGTRAVCAPEGGRCAG